MCKIFKLSSLNWTNMNCHAIEGNESGFSCLSSRTLSHTRAFNFYLLRFEQLPVSFELEDNIWNICHKHHNAACSWQLKGWVGWESAWWCRIPKHQWQHVAQQPQQQKKRIHISLLLSNHKQINKQVKQLPT